MTIEKMRTKAVTAAAKSGSSAGRKPARRRRKPPVEIIREIREAGLDLFTKNGFEATTVNDIVARISVSRRTFFRYFAAKEDIVFSWVDSEAEAAWPLLVSRTGQEEPLKAMRRAFSVLASRHASDLENTRRMMTLIFGTPALQGQFYLEHARWQAKLDEALGSSCPLDEATFFKLRVLNTAAVSAYMTAIQAWVSAKGGPPLNLLVSAAFDALEHAQKPAAADPATTAITQEPLLRQTA